MGVSLKTTLQLVVVALLLVAISVQLSMRRRLFSVPLTLIQSHNYPIGSNAGSATTNVNAAGIHSSLQDFFLQSAERQVRKQLQQGTGTAVVVAGKGNMTSSLLYASQGASTTTTTNVSISSLGCIDVVRKCLRYKDESYPAPLLGGNSAASTNNTSATVTPATLALVDPVLKGGYRNQYMRFVALVAQAISNNQTILLESIKWHEKSSHNGIPFEMMFDVDTWNANPNLPKFVTYDRKLHPQWNPKTTLFLGTCTTTASWFPSPHRVSFTSQIQDRTAPYPAGGGRSGQPGNLWDFYRRHDKFGLQIPVHQQGTTISLQELEAWILNSMKPSSVVQALVDSIQPPSHANTPYIALHPRIEPEMLVHVICQEGKMKLLQEILDQVMGYPDFATYSQLFIAVAMPQMSIRQRSNARWYNDHVQNIATLRTIFEKGITRPNDGTQVQVWTAGEASLKERNVNQCMITLLASIVNMELAIKASVFVGTRVSTWSNSVWKVRHYRGLPNYEFTPNGIQKLEELPPPFKC